MKNLIKISLLFSGIILLSPGSTSAHCDGLDGPVVKAAQKSLETGNVNYVLIWVQKNDEGDVIKAFEETINVRKLSSQAQDLADMYFYETVVRIHRSGEGEPYTGLKPAGRDLDPAIISADKVLEEASVEPLLKILNYAVEQGIQSSFKEAIERKKFNPDNLETGREYVETYVKFIHQVENIYNSAKLTESHKENDNTHEHAE